MKKTKLSKSTINKLSKSWIGILLIVAVLAFQYYQESKPIEPGKRFDATFEKCVDGDTAWFNVNGKSTKVRFLYVDTPESTSTVQPYGKEASKFVENELKDAKNIELELNVDGNQYDKYGRMLAWVFVDDKLLQEEIASHGYAKKFYDYGSDYTYKSIIIEADKQAKDKHVGIYK